ncbi:MAG: hypothetical protein OXM55_03440 [Bdellovibrionales bacterium]|nr:hypothetical protein [Bdellovibrionales bacterium]
MMLTHCPFFRDDPNSFTGDIGYTFTFSKEVPMPWKESSAMDERTKFISKLLQEEKMTIQQGELFQN